MVPEADRQVVIEPARFLPGRALSDDELREAHAVAADTGRPRAERRRARLVLRRKAERGRAQGTADADNLALQLVRALGTRRPRRGRPTLERLGLSEPLAPRVSPKYLDTLDQFLETAGKEIGAITKADVDAFASAARCKSSTVKRRSDLRRAFIVLIDLGLASENPAPLIARERTRSAPLPGNGPRFEAWLKKVGFLPSSREKSRDGYRELARWAAVENLDLAGVPEALWSDPEMELLQRLVFWWARPREKDGKPRSKTCIAALDTFLHRLWRWSGHDPVDARDKLRRLWRRFRSSGADQGDLDKLDLAPEDPAPAPRKERCEALPGWYAEQIAGLRASARSRTRLVRMLRERDAFFCWTENGARRKSFAGFRFDQLFQDERGHWYFDEVPTKKTRQPKRVVNKVWKIGEQWFSRWYVPPTLVALFAETLQAEDARYDLMDYLRTRRRELVPWVVARDDTFGAHMKGKQVSAVWRGRPGHLTIHGVYQLGVRIVRERLGAQRGGPHALRRRAIMNKNALAKMYPQAAQALQHLTPKTRAIYEWSEDNDVGLMWDAPAAPSSATGASAAVPTDAAPGPRARRAVRRTLPMPTLEDLRRAG